MELNAIANIHMTIEHMYTKKEITKQQYEFFINQIFLFKDYVKAYEIDKSIIWHEFIAKQKLSKIA